MQTMTLCEAQSSSLPGTENDLYVPNWYAIYTRSRHENSVHQDLIRRRIETFLPLRRISRQWSDRIKSSSEPLFKGYVFVKISLLQKLDVLRVDGVVHFLSKGDYAIPVPEKELDTVRYFLEKEIDVTPFPYLECGAPVRVVRGLLKGAEGILMQMVGHSRLVISLHDLRQSISVEIDASNVQPL